jgi:fatty acid desaturase
MAASVPRAATTLSLPIGEYSELKRLIQQEGLLVKQGGHYTWRILATWSMLAGGLIFLVLAHHLWLQILDAVYLAWVFTQVAFISHDAGHRQIFGAAWKNDLLGYVNSDLLLGMSYGWWFKKHNDHHGNPNRMDLDPDVDLAALAFSEEQIRAKRGVLKFITKFQAHFFFPLLSFTAYSMRAKGLLSVLQRKETHYRAEASLIGLHLALYFGLLAYWLGVTHAALFIVVHQALFGLYMGSIFAPNHKGMLTLGKDEPMDFLRQQVLTARNVRPGPVTDFMYGGLNYQIEHHLFPSMARNKMREAQKIVKAFCRRYSISYHETGMVQSYREILRHLHKVGSGLREAHPEVSADPDQLRPHAPLLDLVGEEEPLGERF